jgi:hypothetical protein
MSNGGTTSRQMMNMLISDRDAMRAREQAAARSCSRTIRAALGSVAGRECTT